MQVSRLFTEALRNDYTNAIVAAIDIAYPNHQSPSSAAN